MADEGVFMDVEAVRGIANGFQHASETLKTVSQGLEISIQVLRDVCFTGFIGAAALECYLESIKPNVDRLASKCEEMRLDIESAISAYTQGDQSGSKRFQGSGAGSTAAQAAPFIPGGATIWGAAISGEAIENDHAMWINFSDPMVDKLIQDPHLADNMDAASIAAVNDKIVARLSSMTGSSIGTGIKDFESRMEQIQQQKEAADAALKSTEQKVQQQMQLLTTMLKMMKEMQEASIRNLR